jgi:hypothetical protein
MTIGADSQTGVMVPPPLRWTKRWVMFCIGFAAALSVWWVVWDRYAQQRLQEQVDAIVARHEPLYQSDFPEPVAAPGQNAALFLRAAFAALSIKDEEMPPTSSNMQYKQYPPYSAEWYRRADASLAANAKALALVRQASGCAVADWGPYSAPPLLLHVYRADFGEERRIAIVLADAAMDEHMHHDDAEAVADIEDMLHQGDAIEQMTPPDLVDDMVALVLEDIGIARLEIMAPDLEVERRGQTARAGVQPASRRAVERLITELLRKDVRHDAERRAVQGDRMVSYDYFVWLSGQMTILGPAVRLEAARMLRGAEVELGAVDDPGSVPSPVPSGATSFQPPKSGFARFFWDMGGSLDLEQFRYALISPFNQAGRYAAATALAVRLFRVDQGRWPRSLAELVPTYLAEVPDDPEVRGEKIGYLLERGGLPGGGDRPLLFFGSAELRRNRGQPPGEPQFGEWGMERLEWIDLSRWVPTTGPATASTTGPGAGSQ